MEKFKAYDNDKAVAEKYAAKMNERQQASLIQF